VDAPRHWGTSSLERAATVPADALVPDPAARWTRGTTAVASPGRLWRWLCQLTVAPYSYDLVDNRGRPSPTTLTPGADELRVGQRLLVLFVVDSFVVGEHLTIRLARPGRGVLGEFAVTYAVRSDGAVGTLVRHGLAWGDLMMMRRQLTRLATLAGRETRLAP
jgi:hypothetical protein